MKATKKTIELLNRKFYSFVNRPVSFEFEGTTFFAIYANGKKNPSFFYNIFSGMDSTWKDNYQDYLNTFEAE
jgi:hypothetical protein